jgi:hypothetical protein
VTSRARVGLTRGVLALIALATSGCPGIGADRPFYTFEIVGPDGVTNVDADGIVLDLIGTSRTERVALSVATWPELEPVAAEVEATAIDHGVHYEVRPASPLGARWHVLLASLEPAAANEGYAVSHSVALDDGRVGFRVFGASAPRIRSVRWHRREPELPDDWALVTVVLSERLEGTTAPPEIDVTLHYDPPATAGACWLRLRREVELECIARASPPRTATIEVRAPVMAEGGGTLEPQTITADDLSNGFVAPIDE